MRRRPPRSTRTDTLFPYTTLFRSRISEADYAELAGDAQDFLAGKSTKVQRKLGAAMQSASDAMDFELAAVYRDRLKALTFIQGSQAINAEIGRASCRERVCQYV